MTSGSSTDPAMASAAVSMTIPPSSASLESRIAALEIRVGKMTAVSHTPVSAQEVSARLDKLQHAMDTHLNSVQIGSVWKESLKLIQELDPDIALTYQQQPLLYKRQQVLAAARHLQQDMHQLDAILKLLTTDTKSQDNLRLDQITQAPIVSSPHYTQSPADLERLDTVRLHYRQLTKRIQTLQQQLQNMLQCYHTCMVASSQKLILAQEKCRNKMVNHSRCSDG